MQQRIDLRGVRILGDVPAGLEHHVRLQPRLGAFSEIMGETVVLAR